MNAGISTGAAAAGLLVGHLPLEVGFALAGGAALLAAAAVGVGTRYPRALPQEPEPEPEQEQTAETEAGAAEQAPERR
ncbi:hypothetical protein ACWIID_37035 [Streptomyces phaeochromogenes]